MVRLLVAAVLAAAVFTAAASSISPGALDEKVLRAHVPGSGARDAIEVTLFRPDGAGPFPVIVLSHGSPRSANDRRRGGRIRFEAQSRALVKMGYAVVVPTRRGYGDSGGEWAEDYGSCRNPDYYGAGLETARDILAALDAVRGESKLDLSHVVLMGQSAGGWGSLAAATRPIDGLVGVVNFAGGRGSQSPSNVCVDGNLVDAAARYGKASRVPQLWFYSANDLFFDPDLAARMHAAFVGAGGKAELVKAPPTGKDGHAYFSREIDQWSAPVEAFLGRVTGKKKKES